jgi:hypothetical protein
VMEVAAGDVCVGEAGEELGGCLYIGTAIESDVEFGLNGRSLWMVASSCLRQTAIVCFRSCIA